MAHRTPRSAQCACARTSVHPCPAPQRPRAPRAVAPSRAPHAPAAMLPACHPCFICRVPTACRTRVLSPAAACRGCRPVLAQENYIGRQAWLTDVAAPSLWVWDAIRAVDLLAARPEVDGSRLGAMGCSGGGTQTAFLASVDPRIGPAVVACYSSTFERQVRALVAGLRADQRTRGVSRRAASGGELRAASCGGGGGPAKGWRLVDV